MKHLEDTPWWICDTEDTNYCAYMDTDSVYLTAEPLLLHLYPDFEDKNDEDKDNILEKVALKYQDIITKYYNTLAKDCFNSPNHRLDMKTEAVIRTAYFRATRRYAQWITKKEGLEVNELDIKGLEFMKANFPPILGEFFNSRLKQELKGEKHDKILFQIKDFKQQILTGAIPITKLGNPTRVTKLEKYSGRSARAGEMFTVIEKGAPAPVRAAIRYNDLLKFWQLDKKHNYITQSDKIKWVYMQNNPYKIEALGFLEYDIPDKIQEFMEKYVDRQKIFDSILLNKLEGFFGDLEWSLDLNPHKEAFTFFDI
jgi:DNA polymerase elongation subunit (family B)